MFYYISFFQCIISEVPQPIAAKFCVMLGSMFYFITPIQKFGSLPPKKNWGGGKKHDNFGLILNSFPL